MSGTHDGPATFRLGGNAALLLFAAVLVAFVAESQLTQYVQTTLGYHHPFFLFYLVHTSFIVSFPLHFLYLLYTTNYTPRGLLSGLTTALARHLSSWGLGGSGVVPSSQFPLHRFLGLVVIITIAYNVPALLWFAAISLASVTDVTAIWNANAFFAYVFTVKMMNLKWSALRLGAVCLATLGVLTVVYGGSTAPSDGEPDHEYLSAAKSTVLRPSAPLVGDLLTLVASLCYGLYQVLYKKYVALPSDSELESEPVRYTHVATSAEALSDQESAAVSRFDDGDNVVYPPPFGLHPNLLTSTIGLCTFLLLWIPIPFLHHYGIEQFALPSNIRTVFAIAGICFTGVIFNAGFMILLGLWGPVITSVGNLLTIVLSLFSDLMFGSVGLTKWGLLGAGMIVGAFSVLVYDMSKR
ncbi:hypothetical protein BV22DRAFT_1053502 [Leucogyrophana mollusca]|uniref:Uncharacterized protein n=1 Tax=Leucogyrophana mollusca TaxID=85980 RepID=A0ACB8BZM9_9AGAM|nr:hypothetical protein BV22DRAFT_1053502 [Leucogyrophana mollusca]